eukprot:157661-Prorocentrum_minimum.AAC.1
MLYVSTLNRPSTRPSELAWSTVCPTALAGVGPSAATRARALGRWGSGATWRITDRSMLLLHFTGPPVPITAR